MLLIATNVTEKCIGRSEFQHPELKTSLYTHVGQRFNRHRAKVGIEPPTLVALGTPH